MTIKFFYDNDTVKVHNIDSEYMKDHLIPNIYTARYHPMMGFYLQFSSDKFKMPSTIYGNTETRVDKIINTYNHRSSNTGVMLTGTKGSGKSMLSQMLCNKMLEKGIPVIVVSEPYAGVDFNAFISDIGECVVFFDEFAKIYGRDRPGNKKSRSGAVSSSDDDEKGEQEDLLSLLDGVNNCKRLVIITENETYDINEFLLDRPSRIYYHFDYDRLENDVVEQYCLMNGFDIKYVQELLAVSSSLASFSFDILQTIVAESKLYPDLSLLDVLKDLNICVNDRTTKTYLPIEVVRLIDDKQMYVHPDTTISQLESYQDVIHFPIGEDRDAFVNTYGTSALLHTLDTVSYYDDEPDFIRNASINLDKEHDERVRNLPFVSIDLSADWPIKKGNQTIFTTDKYLIKMVIIEKQPINISKYF